MNRITRHPGRPFWPAYAPGVTWAAVYLSFVIGVGLALQPERFAHTPSYANLLALAPSQVWGCCAYLLVAALLIAWRLSPRTRALGVTAHAAAALLIAWWFIAFVIRWSTDRNTTVVNMVSWSLFLGVIALSAQGVDDESA